MPQPFNSLEFWSGLGKGILVALFLYVLLVIALSQLGVTNALVPRPRRRPPQRDKRDGAETEPNKSVVNGQDANDDQSPRRTPSEGHLEFLDRLRTTLRYQGATVSLLVFSVLILAVLGILSGAEAATILSGIAGYVLGATKNESAPPASPENPGGGSGGEGGRGQRKGNLGDGQLSQGGKGQ